MSESEDHVRLTPEGWATLVAMTLADHPDWVGVTVNAMQDGVVEAIERHKDRALTLSTGLMEAVRTERRAKGRVHDRVIDAIEVCNFHPTKWSAAAIEREKQNRDRQEQT